MAMQPGTFSVRWESLLGEATLFHDQEYLMMMASHNVEMFLCSTGRESSALLIQGRRFGAVLCVHLIQREQLEMNADPLRNEEGIYYAIDLGGTNFRVLRVEVGAGSVVISRKVEHEPIPQELTKGAIQLYSIGTKEFYGKRRWKR
ncbi:hypothetical protein PR202_ga08346 [Eleusine coracana subsp. coracana]|uniref:Phosphotransferase n=1 Tax=Eleusine coracana subsp. coracana TaxID=191504 RepID=A0AAV5C2I4_ELECO|nr:hypothetical protein PR202_ga08346 [Eleusine coracana subsp. coracana]